MSSKDNCLCVITPRLPPAIDGLGDYCRQLWEHTRELAGGSLGGAWHFLVTEGAEESSKVWEGLSIDNFPKSREGLRAKLDALHPETIILQYVGYGYDTAGKPQWLADALGQWKQAHPSTNLVTMFHETWASGMPWQKAFWHQPGQIQCAQDLLKACDFAVTSNMATLRDLESLKSGKEVSIIPIGCSFNGIEPVAKNWRQLLVMGRHGSRDRALSAHAALIRTLVERKLVERIVLAGELETQANDAGTTRLKDWGLPVQVDTVYNFSRDCLPEPVLNSGLSLMHTESTCLLKSTSFQLACAAGQVAISLQEEDPGQGVIPGKHYLGYKPRERHIIASQLHSSETLAQVGRAAQTLGSTTLSWPAIAKSWNDLLCDKG